LAELDPVESGRSNVRFEGFLGLHREANRNVGGSVKPLKNLVAEHAPIFALRPRTGRQFDAAIAGMTGRARQIGFLHADVMPCLREPFQPERITFSSHGIDIWESGRGSTEFHEID
jgi:hypothetical protein